MIDAKHVGPIAGRARRVLAGHPAPIQAAVLADLVSIYLAGHMIKDDEAETNALREHLLELHVAYVRELLPINAQVIHGKKA
jgi:hypothetical protein